MDVPLDKAFEDYVAERVETGQFESKAEVVEDALRMQQGYLRKLDILRREIQKGIDDIEEGRFGPPPTIDELIASARLRKQQQ